MQWTSIRFKGEQHHRLILFYKIVNNLAPSYLKDVLPRRVNIRTDYNLRNSQDIDVPFCRLNRYLYSFFPSTIRAWNTLDDAKRTSPSVAAFKSSFRGNTDLSVPSWYYQGTRVWSVHHTRLRMNCSKLNYDLSMKMFVIPSAACSCGNPKEDAHHFFYICSNYDHIRPTFLNNLYAIGPTNLRTLLLGNNDLNLTQNCRIFDLVQDFIKNSGRFG